MSSMLHNPGLEDAEACRARFVARAPLLRVVVEDLSGQQPQHHLFIGQRGMGKTTLLRRIAAEVDHAPALRARWIALSFPEEQYNVASLSDLWVNSLNALADALERQGAGSAAGAVDTFIEALPDEEEARAARALEHLLRGPHAGRGLVLCIDNLQQVLGRLRKEERWALRKVLGAEARLVICGASPALPAALAEHGEPFYDFFHAHWLPPLSLGETTTLLRTLAEQEQKPEVADAVDARPARLRALHVLTGGNPRTVVQLFTVIAHAPGQDIRRQLEALLDQCTPLYKARFEELADQAQVVLDAVALAWDPVTAASLAARTRLDVNTISTQLSRLYAEGVVEKVDIAGESRQGFQVAERFFNLWYLMRASRRARGRVLSLAHCLEILYDLEELEVLGASLVREPGAPDLSMAVARVLRVLATREQRAAVAGAMVQGIDVEDLGLDRGAGEVLMAEAVGLAHDAPGDAVRMVRHAARLLPPENATAVMTQLMPLLLHASHLPEAQALAEDLKASAPPVYAAVAAIVANDAALLTRYAPEVAGPARDLLRSWRPALLTAPPAPAPKRRRR